MYGEDWIYREGSGGLSGGGGANGEWIWGEPQFEESYEYTCASPLGYLGLIYDVVTADGETSWKTLMRVQKSPSNINYRVFGDPKEIEANYVSGLEYEYEEYTHLPIPENQFDSGDLTWFSDYTSTTAYRIFTDTFDGATYYTPVACYPGIDTVVRTTRGSDYIDSLPLGNIAGIQRSWQFYYQASIVEHNDLPGMIVDLLEGASVPHGLQPLIGGMGIMESLLQTFVSRKEEL